MHQLSQNRYNRGRMKIYTLGHSTRQTTDMLHILRQFDIGLLVDVRSIPRSRYNPHFNSTVFSKELGKHGIVYQHMESLGGLRKPRADSPNTGWRNEGFRGYADYMQTAAFSEALDYLLEQAASNTSAIMCAEAVPWRCHRSLLSDALLVRGGEVHHILDARKTQPATMTDFADINGTNITYPARNSDQQSL